MSSPSAEKLGIVIRKYCRVCCGNSSKMVERCGIADCPLHPYRSIKAMESEGMDREYEYERMSAEQISFFSEKTGQTQACSVANTREAAV